ncbi:hypothetical protein AGMMS49944_21910 [Spirochaetia bacterium]|nr:hypothetical protein AGMMS49944_21910 [Spirochaetia bacterium]
MTVKHRFVLLILSVLGIAACASVSTGETFSGGDGEISARGAVGRLEAVPSGPMFEGDGGKDIRLAVLAPEVQGAAPEYLPVYVQGLLNNNFKKYGNVTLVDRQNLDRIIAEQNLAANGRFTDADFVKIGGITNAQYFLIGTIQKHSGDQYSLQLSMSDSSTGEHKAIFMKNGALRQIEGSGTLINEASADLLAQLGVRLTVAGKQALLAGNTAVVRSETGLAKGITAQASGESVEALFNYTQAINFDSSQIEALARLNVLSSSISGGSLSERIVNDLQARDRWLEVFKEASRFFNEHPPFEITFDPNLVQEGETDYAKRTANLAMRVALDPSEAGFAALNALLGGLEQTGRREAWGFKGWPLQDIHPKTPGTVVFTGKQSLSFKLDATLLNENDKALGKSSVTLSSGTLHFAAGGNEVVSDGAVSMMRFTNVKAEDLTPTLTIVIRAVNGIPSATLNANGYMRIDTGDLEGKFAFTSSGNVLEDFVFIQGGTFTMGSPASEPDRESNETQHQVTVSGFYMGKYEVTQQEYKKVMGTNPSRWKGSNLPVEQVSWFDALEYCNKRSRREGLTPAYTISETNVTWDRNANGYRLPTEAEWEYACRAGTTTPFSTGNNIRTSQANYDGNYPWDKTTAVGSFASNAWGLYDMHGNVWEWCWDWYGDYNIRARTDPTGAASGSDHVLRGGGWGSGAQHLRSATRHFSTPSNWGSVIGFRVVRP